VGEVLAGRYELATPLGRGGMGQVWEGTDRQLGRRVAVKLLTNEQIAARSDPSELVRRFAREASLTAGLQHPGVPAVHDAGAYDGGLFLVMELIEGYTLADLVAEQGPLPIGWAAAIAAQVCGVLAIAHERGLVHRDIKPQNLMLTRDGTVKVLDFGVATVLDAAGVPRITRTGEPVGTPAYMAPEQLRGERATPRTDLYALGCVLYELLAGQPVFTATTQHALSYKHLEENPEPLRRGDLPLEVDSLVRHLLTKEPAQRPANAREVYERLLVFVARAAPLGDMNPAGAMPSAMHLYARVLTRLSGATVPPASVTSTDMSMAVGGRAPYQSAAYANGPYSSGPRPAGHHPSGPQPAGHQPLGLHSSGPQPAGRHPSGPYGGNPQAATPPGMPPGGAMPGLRRSAWWRLLHSWWALPSLMLGLFTWLGFLYVGVRHRRRSWFLMGVGYLLLAIGLIALLINIPDENHPLNNVGIAYLMVLWLGGFLHTVWVAVVRLDLRAVGDFGGRAPGVGEPASGYAPGHRFGAYPPA
jgi:serine/threonine protein kinase